MKRHNQNGRRPPESTSLKRKGDNRLVLRGGRGKKKGKFVTRKKKNPENIPELKGNAYAHEKGEGETEQRALQYLHSGEEAEKKPRVGKGIERKASGKGDGGSFIRAISSKKRRKRRY